MICRKCGMESDRNFCANCGTPMEQTIVCSHCGAECTGRFCQNCGKSVVPIQKEMPVNSAPAHQPVKEKPLSKRERIKENKRNGIACCPKCGSASITGNKKGYSFVKGGIGATVTMATGVGAIFGLGAGNIGSKKIIITCMACGHQWKP